MKGIPLWLKIAFTAWMAAWVIVYAGFYGPQNFFWICNLCNFILLVGLWTENRLLVSSQIVAVLVIDLLWSVDLITAFLSGLGAVGVQEGAVGRSNSATWFWLFPGIQWQ